MIFEYYENNLSKDIAIRAQTDSHYTEQELWFISESMISSLQYLQASGIYNEDISPRNIMISTDGAYKIGDYGLLTRGLTSYFQLLAGKTGASYISPELLTALRKKQSNPEHDIAKSDAYSLGMTLLHAATLKDIAPCYNFTMYNINNDQLHAFLSQARQMYSAGFVNFLSDLLVEDLSRRMDFLTIHNNMQSQQVNYQVPAQLMTRPIPHSKSVYKVEEEVEEVLKEESKECEKEVAAGVPPVQPVPVQGVQAMHPV